MSSKGLYVLVLYVLFVAFTRYTNQIQVIHFTVSTGNPVGNFLHSHPSTRGGQKVRGMAGLGSEIERVIIFSF